MADSVTTLLEDLPATASSHIDAAAIRARLQAAAISEGTRESWKYSRLQKFIEPVPQAEVCLPRITGSEHPQVAMSRLAQDGAPLNHLGDVDSAEKYLLADMALLVCGDRILLKIADNASVELSIDFPDGINVPVLIEVGSNARLQLLESSSAASFANQTLYLELGRNAQVHHARTAFETDCTHWSFTQVVLGEAADYALETYLGGGLTRRSETQVVMQGANSHAALIGGYRVIAGTHLDQQFNVEHRNRNTTSTQKFHGLGAGKGSATFNGRIHIHPGAPGSDGQLSNKNLALHPDAIINTKPELEIYTDDVKCAHGATIGQLSTDSLFFLRARGISDEVARAMLCRAFIRECIQGPLAQAAALGLLDDSGALLDAQGQLS